jgi:hypothetical protein
MNKTKIPIREGKRLCEEYKAPVVIIFALVDNGDRIAVTTYGATKALCRHAADLSKKIVDKVMSGEIAPEQTEPLDLPNDPTIWTGRKRTAATEPEAKPIELALTFHRYYEELAPRFGYETRTETRQFDPNSSNGRLMIAVCEKILDQGFCQAEDKTLTEPEAKP